MPKLLFASWHCLIDPASGAAIATRDLLELLIARGWQCRAFCGPQLDFEAAASIPALLAEQQIPSQTHAAPPGMPPFELHHFRQADLRGTVYVPQCSPPRCSPLAPQVDNRLAQRVDHSPPPEHEAAFLTLLDRYLQRERPDLLLTYGGLRIARRLMALARTRGVPVVFALHNTAYHNAELFRDAAAILVPSVFTRDHYRRTLGLDSAVIPSPINWMRVRCRPDHRRRYVTFINPQPPKGLFIFARIALELGRSRPDIPLLIVEGRGRAKNWLMHTGLDLTGLRNLHRMAATPDPRRFYAASRIVLMPSLCEESFGRVAAESLINGLPVLATRRGALPELLRDAGFLFDLPERYTATSRLVPTAEEIRPWTETIIRLWDDEPFYQQQRRRCLAAAEVWRPEHLADRYDEFFQQAIQTSRPRPLISDL